jgi:hypothetical protein
VGLIHKYTIERGGLIHKYTIERRGLIPSTEGRPRKYHSVSIQERAATAAEI